MYILSTIPYLNEKIMLSKVKPYNMTDLQYSFIILFQYI